MDAAPFTEEYVIEATKAQMAKSVDFSICRTIQRLEEFKSCPVTLPVVHRTLARLIEIKENINDIAYSPREKGHQKVYGQTQRPHR